MGASFISSCSLFVGVGVRVTIPGYDSVISFRPSLRYSREHIWRTIKLIKLIFFDNENSLRRSDFTMIASDTPCGLFFIKTKDWESFCPVAFFIYLQIWKTLRGKFKLYSKHLRNFNFDEYFPNRFSWEVSYVVCSLSMPNCCWFHDGDERLTLTLALAFFNFRWSIFCILFLL